MKNINKTLFQALLATLAWPAANAMAMPVDQTRCEFQQLASANLKVHVRDLNTFMCHAMRGSAQRSAPQSCSKPLSTRTTLPSCAGPTASG